MTRLTKNILKEFGYENTNPRDHLSEREFLELILSIIAADNIEEYLACETIAELIKIKLDL